MVTGKSSRRINRATNPLNQEGVTTHGFDQKNSQGSVRITDLAAVPMCYCRIEARVAGVIWETIISVLPDELAQSLEGSIQEKRPDNDAIKTAVGQNEAVPGAEVRRGSHLRVA